MNWIAQLFCKHKYKVDLVYYILDENYTIFAKKKTLRCIKCNKIKTETKTIQK